MVLQQRGLIRVANCSAAERENGGPVTAKPCKLAIGFTEDAFCQKVRPPQLQEEIGAFGAIAAGLEPARCKEWNHSPP